MKRQGQKRHFLGASPKTKKDKRSPPHSEAAVVPSSVAEACNGSFRRLVELAENWVAQSELTV